ncbi:hypothetical protein ACQ9BO_09030 [Flavobacterium sp. P21]|uniref:hypothetical protein n=1 Tax=Flavobacterium sp. P21 TaxID=3423948 RepID=UPI003D67CFC6
MKLQTLYRISERIINLTTDSLRKLKHVFEFQNNIFTQDYKEIRKAKYPQKHSSDLRAASNQKAVLLEMMKESEPFWL